MPSLMILLAEQASVPRNQNREPLRVFSCSAANSTSLGMLSSSLFVCRLKWTALTPMAFSSSQVGILNACPYSPPWLHVFVVLSCGFPARRMLYENWDLVLSSAHWSVVWWLEYSLTSIWFAKARALAGMKPRPSSWSTMLWSSMIAILLLPMKPSIQLCTVLWSLYSGLITLR